MRLLLPSFTPPVLFQLGVSFLVILFLFSYSKNIAIISFNVCVFTAFVKAFAPILFKVLDHIHNSCFEALVLCFVWITFFRGAGFRRRQMAFLVCIFAIGSKHLELGYLRFVSWCKSLVLPLSGGRSVFCLLLPPCDTSKYGVCGTSCRECSRKLWADTKERRWTRQRGW